LDETPSIHERLASQLGVEPKRLGGIDSEVAALIEARIDLDDLTGVLRRRAGLTKLQAELDAARKTDAQGLVVAFVDLHDLRSINMRHGHDAGDRALRQFANVLSSRLPSSGYVIRWGGDEFICVFPGFGRQAALEILEDIRARADVGFSAGISMAETGDRADAVVKRADHDLHKPPESSADS
jgi:diguanylate cyclase (GGDEF)-like protein